MMDKSIDWHKNIVVFVKEKKSFLDIAYRQVRNNKIFFFHLELNLRQERTTKFCLDEIKFLENGLFLVTKSRRISFD